MDEGSSLPPPPLTVERCYRHPQVETRIHCTRCGRPICPDCMVPAPVGHQCPTCVEEARSAFKPKRTRVATGPQRGFSLTNVILVVLIGTYLVEVAAGGLGTLIGGPSEADLIRLGANVGLFRWPQTGTIVGVATGEYWRLFTAMFLHAGLLHLAFNGYALYLFGNIVETELGRGRFIAIYFVTGLCASAASYAFSADSFSVGASGAIFGLFGAFFAYNWRRRHLAFYAARMRQAGQLIVLNLILSFALSSLIDWRAHVGGLISGIVAGVAAEGLGGDPKSKRLTFAAAMVALIAFAIVATIWKTGQFRADFPGLF